MVTPGRVEDYGGIFIFLVDYGVIVCAVVIGCVRCRIRSVEGIVGVVIVAVSVIAIDGVISSDQVAPPVCDFKAIRILEFHPADHFIDPSGHCERRTFIPCNKVASFDVEEVV